jgi:hypothetical protein
VSLRDDVRAECLRALNCPEAFPRRSVHNYTVQVNSLHRVYHRHRRNARPVLSSALHRPADQFGGHKRPRGIVDGCDLTVDVSEAVANRVLPAPAALYYGSHFAKAAFIHQRADSAQIIESRYHDDFLNEVAGLEYSYGLRKKRLAGALCKDLIARAPKPLPAACRR